MQTQEDAQRLIAAGADVRRVRVTGNFKVDGVGTGGDAGRAILAQAGLPTDRCLLAQAPTTPKRKYYSKPLGGCAAVFPNFFYSLLHVIRNVFLK